jgi:hypothetical protein
MGEPAPIKKVEKWLNLCPAKPNLEKKIAENYSKKWHLESSKMPVFMGAK